MQQPTRAAQFKTLVRQASVELHLPHSHDRTQRLALIRLERRSIKDLRLLSQLSGKLSDPSKLIDADQRLAEEEAKLAPAAGSSGHSVKVSVVSSKLCPRCRAEMSAVTAPPVVSLPVPLTDAVEVEPVSGDGSDSELTSERLNGSGRTKSRSNVVELDRGRSRDIHHGQHAVLKSETSRDPNIGGFGPKGQA
jgi:hypothetical protein